MKTWEIIIEVRVRKTLHLGGVATEAAVRDLVGTLLDHGASLGTLQKYRDAGGYGRVEAVEVIVDNAPRILEVREVDP